MSSASPVRIESLQHSLVKGLRALRERAPGIAVYMLTNYPASHYRRLAAELGARGFFDKSTEFNRVREEIAACAGATH